MGLLACVVVESCAELGCSGGWVRFAMRATRPSGEEFSARSQFALVDVVTACVLHLACALAPKAGRDQSAILAQVDTQELTATPVGFSTVNSFWCVTWLQFRVATAALDIAALRSHARVMPHT
jgi:hypothetical protein